MQKGSRKKLERIKAYDKKWWLCLTEHGQNDTYDVYDT